MARRQPRWIWTEKISSAKLRKRWAEAALKKEVGTGASSVAVRGGASTQWAITATWTSFSAFDATPALKIMRHTYPRIRCGPSAALFPSITLSRATCRCILARTDPYCASFLNLLNKREICHSTLNRRNLLAYSIGFRLALLSPHRQPRPSPLPKTPGSRCARKKSVSSAIIALISVGSQQMPLIERS